MLGGGNIDKNSWDDKVKIEKVVKRKYSFFNLSSVYVALVSIFLYLLLAQVVPTFYYGALFIFIPYVIFLLIKLVFALLIDRIDLKNEMFCDICGLVFYLPFAFINFMPQGTTLYTYLILTPVLISIFSLWYHINNRKVSLFLVLYILIILLYINRIS